MNFDSKVELLLPGIRISPEFMAPKRTASRSPRRTSRNPSDGVVNDDSFVVECREPLCRRDHPEGATFKVYYHRDLRRCELMCNHCGTFRWTLDHPVAQMGSAIAGVP